MCKDLGHGMPKDDESYTKMLEAFSIACDRRFVRKNPDPLDMKSKWGGSTYADQVSYDPGGSVLFRIAMPF